MNRVVRRIWHSATALACVLPLICEGCTLVRPVRTESPKLFALEGTFETPPGRDSDPQPLAIATPRARPGLDSARIVYVSRTYEVSFFAKSQWVDTPARMLAPLLVQALGASRRFQPIRSGAGVAAALRLETEITALQQEFTVSPSQVRFALRAQLVDVAEHRIVATRDLEAVEPSASDDAYGGVVAANQAVHRLLRELAAWCDGYATARGSLSGTRALLGGRPLAAPKVLGLEECDGSAASPSDDAKDGSRVGEKSDLGAAGTPAPHLLDVGPDRCEINLMCLV